MIRGIIFCLLWLALSSGSALVRAEGRLSEASNATRNSDGKSSGSKEKAAESSTSGGSSKSSSGSSGGSFLASLLSGDSDCGCESSDSDGSSAMASLFLVGVTSPWWFPRMLVDDKDEVLLHADYPYKRDWDGYFVDQDLAPGWAKRWSGRYLAESGTDFDGLQKHGGRLRLDTSSRFGLDTEWNYRREELMLGHNSLWNGDVNLIYRFAQSQHGAFYTGVGVNWLNGSGSGSSSGGGKAGFNFTYGADFYPARPWVLSGSIDWGTLGHATLFHGRATVGVMYKRVEVFTGYDYFKLDNVTLPSAVAGVQIHF